MLKFLGTQDLEVYISDVGCLILKQQSIEFGKEVMVIIYPEQAFHIASMIQDYYDEMVDKWNEGMQ